MNLSCGMPPKELVQNKLSSQYVKSGVKWWLGDNRWEQAASEITDCILDTNKINPEAIFKHSERRLVFRFLVKNADQTIVVKAFPLTLLRNQLKQRKYAFSEARNLFLAKERGINVPEIFGYGSKKQWGLVSFNVVLVQYVDHYPLIDFLKSKNEEEYLSVLQQRVSPLFCQMYQAGVNHIDCDPSAIFLSKSNDVDDLLIDFQYAGFFQGRSMQTLAAQLGYFSWSIMSQYKFMSRDSLRIWFEYTIESAGGICNELLWSIYEENSHKPRPIKQRLLGYPLD